MKIILIYFFLFTFFAENSLGFSSIINVKGLSLPNLALYLLILVWASTIVFKRKLIEWNSVNTYVIIFIFFAILSIPYKILLDEIPYAGLKNDIIALKLWIEPFFVFIILFNILDKKKSCEKALLGLMILLLITASSGPLTSFNIVNIGRVTSSGRASGFGDTNAFAAYLVLFFPFVLTFVFYHKSYALRIGSALLLFLTFFSLIFTGSRSGIVAFAVSTFGYLYMLYNQKVIRPRSLFSIMVFVLAVSTISFIFMPNIVKKVVSRLDLTESESIDKFSSGRLGIWRYSFSLVAEKPILGHGFNSMAQISYLRHGVALAAHNRYIEYLVELGVIGCTLFILIFLKVIQVMWNYQKSAPDLWEKKLYIGYIAGLFGYASSMLFVNLYQPRYIFWFYTAVFFRYGQLQEIDEKKMEFKSC